MASYSEESAAHKILSGTTVDDVTLTNVSLILVDVLNEAPEGGAKMYAVCGNASTPAPTAAGANTRVIHPGGHVTFNSNDREAAVVKVIGNSNDYSVEGY